MTDLTEYGRVFDKEVINLVTGIVESKIYVNDPQTYDVRGISRMAAAPLPKRGLKEAKELLLQMVKSLEWFPTALHRYAEKVISKVRISLNREYAAAVAWYVMLKYFGIAPPLAEVVRMTGVSRHVIKVATKLEKELGAIDNKTRLVKYVRWYLARVDAPLDVKALTVLVAMKISADGNPATLAKKIIRQIVYGVDEGIPLEIILEAQNDLRAGKY